MKILRKTAEIFKSWGIALNPDSEQFHLASGRIHICNVCEFKRDNPILHCSVCGCSLKGKIYTPNTFLDVDGSCPHDKWKPVEAEWLIRRDTIRYDTISGGLEDEYDTL